MSWKKHKPFLLMAAVTLSSVAFCLAIGPREPDKVIRYGALVVGDHYKGILNETVGDLETKLHGEATGGSEGYQADQPEATVNQLAELKLQRLRPSVQCGNDSMTLHLLGWSVPDFLVETGEENPVPLSEMPAHCGFSVKRARGDVFLVAKYDGCPITQQGDSYILSLRLWDTPVRMSCSVASPLKVSCLPSAMVIELGVSVDAIKLKVNREWQPLVQACSTCGFTLEAVSSGWIITAPYMSNCFQIEGAHRLLSVLYMYGELTLSCPVVQAPAMTLLPADEFLPVPPAPQAPVDHPFPHDYADAHDHPRSPIVAPKSTAPTSTASSTPTKASARKQLWYAYPYDYARPWPFYHSPPRAPPNSPTVAPKSTAPTSTASSTPTKASARKQLWYAYPYDYARPWPFYHSPPRAPPNSPTVAPKSTAPTSTASATALSATASATPTKASAREQLWYAYPYDYARPWPFYHSPPWAPPNSPTVAPKSTASATASSTPTKASAREQLWYAYPYDYARPWPFYHSPPRAPPNSSTVAPKSTALTSTASTTPTKASAHGQLWYAYDYARPWPFYHSPPRAPLYSPTVAPKSTGSTTMSMPTKAGADQPTKSPKVSPETTAPTIGMKVKPPSDDQQLSYRFPWLPGVYDPLVPNSQSLSVSAPVSLPWILYPRRHSEKDQKHSVPVDAASAGSQSAPFTRNRDDLQPVYPRQKWYYPMYQVPYASQHKPASSVVSPSTIIRREEHGVPQLYSLRYDPLAFSPPMQSSRDSGMYPLISRPAHDHVSASRWWKSVSHPAQLSPLLVKAWPTNKVS